MRLTADLARDLPPTPTLSDDGMGVGGAGLLSYTQTQTRTHTHDIVRLRCCLFAVSSACASLQTWPAISRLHQPSQTTGWVLGGRGSCRTHRHRHAHTHTTSLGFGAASLLFHQHAPHCRLGPRSPAYTNPLRRRDGCWGGGALVVHTDTDTHTHTRHR